MSAPDGPPEHPMAERDLRSRPGRRLTIWLEVQDRARHGSLMVELVKRARTARMRGATVLEGVRGFGASGAVHHSRLLRDDAPLAVVMVDEPERIEAYLRAVDDLLDGVLVVLDDVLLIEGPPS